MPALDSPPRPLPTGRSRSCQRPSPVRSDRPAERQRDEAALDDVDECPSRPPKLRAAPAEKRRGIVTQTERPGRNPPGLFFGRDRDGVSYRQTAFGTSTD